VADDVYVVLRVQYERAEILCTTTHPNITVQLTHEGRDIAVDNKFVSFSPKVWY
jgi:hypothetical protein